LINSLFFNGVECMVDWLFGDLLYWLNAILWCINLLFVCFLVFMPDAVGIFIVANALIVLCGVTGLFARLMRIIPHSLAAAMLAG
ncbi:benzoate/H(+) symporter BenE family transporter, partial [Salmonella enterica subsp. enterica serovar Kentucky]|nr:benzoate/H(+) symporter BenE family transporter [Salmonella enterica subsp. enterica serovar Kentucky]